MDINSGRRNSSKTHESLPLFNVFLLATGIENSLSEETLKCLLKVANKPILAYQLEFLERNKINEIHVITNKKFYQKIADYLIDDYRGNIKYEILTTNKNLETLELFHFIKGKLTTNNFIILSADSILDFNISLFRDKHILNQSLISLILCKDDQKFNNQKLKHLNAESEINIFGLHNKTSNDPYKQIVYHSIIFDDPQNEETIKFSKKLLNSCHDFDVIYNYDDVHFYMFNRKIYSFLDDENIKKLSLIKSDLIPYLINNQFSKKLRDFLIEDTLIDYQRTSVLNDINKEKSKLSKPPKIKIMGFMLEGKNYIYRITNLNKLYNTMTEFQKNIDEIPRIYFSTRNNIKNVFQIKSEEIIKNINSDRPYFEGLENIESITIDSLVAAPYTLIGKKSRINKSVVGTDLSVGVNSKINFSFLFDSIRIGKECNITNCLIGDNVTIEDGCVLTDCFIPSSTKVDAKTKQSNVTIGNDSPIV